MVPSGSPKSRGIAPRLAHVPEAAELSMEAPEQGGLDPALLGDSLLPAAGGGPHDALYGPPTASGPARRGGGGGGSPPAASPAAAGQPTASPPREGKVKRFIVSIKSAGPAFLQRQLESQPSMAPPAAAAARGAAQPRPLQHAFTESPTMIRQYAE